MVKSGRAMYLERKGRHRTFGGKVYKFASWQPTKSEARDSKIYHQTRGWNVRVVPDGGGYSIYTRG